MSPKQSERRCANCGKRPGTQRWGDALSATHGWVTMWCRLCVLEAQVAHAAERANALPGLRASLDAERKRIAASR